MPPSTQNVLILGAGTMGRGIAQVAVTHGWSVFIRDVDDEIVRAAVGDVERRLDRLVEKGRMTADERTDAGARLRPAPAGTPLAGCSLVIEAIIEDLVVKRDVLSRLLPELNDEAIIATNTSSFSVTALGETIGAPQRTVGMHFFNPAPLLKLVEVIAGRETDPAVANRVAEIATSWGKKVARAADVPGFIVNHVARPYYLEAFRILEDGFADAAEIDEAMRTLGGFRMGPLELTDLIGQDVNTATTDSVWRQLGEPPLLTPSPLQLKLVADGHLGRKSGRGVYDYGENPPEAVVAVAPRDVALDDDARAALDDVCAAAQVEGAEGTLAQRYTFARVLAALIVQARLAHERGVASTDDIDTALRYGVNYPRGAFEWADAIGEPALSRWLTALDRTLAVDRFTGTSATHV